VLAACLVVVTTACQFTITSTVRVNRDGSGRFSLRFVVDKELSDLARNSGQDTFSSLCDIRQELSRKGWTVNRSTEGGGLDVAVERPFTGPGDLQTAIDDLARCLSVGTGPNNAFFRLSLERSSDFLKTGTTLQGSINLTSTVLLAQTNISDDTKRQLQTFIAQTGNQFFKFTLTAELAGRVSSTEGEPSEVKGGTVTWSPQLGKTLTVRASASAYNPAALGLIGVPLVLLVGFAIWWIIRRRGAAVPGDSFPEPPAP